MLKLTADRHEVSRGLNFLYVQRKEKFSTGTVKEHLSEIFPGGSAKVFGWTLNAAKLKFYGWRQLIKFAVARWFKFGDLWV